MVHNQPNSSPNGISRPLKIVGTLFLIAASVALLIKRGERLGNDFAKSESVIRQIQSIENTPIGGSVHLKGIGDLYVTHETNKTLYTLIGPVKPLDGHVSQEDAIWATLLSQQFSLGVHDTLPGDHYRIWWNSTQWYILSDSAQEVIIEALQKHLQDKTLTK